jgi:hypothetical protein
LGAFRELLNTNGVQQKMRRDMPRVYLMTNMRSAVSEHQQHTASTRFLVEESLRRVFSLFEATASKTSWYYNLMGMG